jgi:hypothetical protein
MVKIRLDQMFSVLLKTQDIQIFIHKQGGEINRSFIGKVKDCLLATECYDVILQYPVDDSIHISVVLVY